MMDLRNNIVGCETIDRFINLPTAADLQITFSELHDLSKRRAGGCPGHINAHHVTVGMRRPSLPTGWFIFLNSP